MAVSSGIASIAATIYAQQADSSKILPRREYIDNFFPEVANVGAALGDRLSKVGTERVTTTGVLTDIRGVRPVTLVWQLPGSFSLLEQGPGARSIQFDGGKFSGSTGKLSELEQKITESLFLDTTEAFLYALHQEGAAFRVLGRRFRNGTDRSSNYTGPFWDIYEVTNAVKTSEDMKARTKLFFFDSDTSYLVRVEYHASSDPLSPMVRTEYSNWTKQAGLLVPSAISRTESKQIVFRFQTTQALLSPRVAVAL